RPETFPKQPKVSSGRFGNWLRLPGHHHSRDHWSRVWDGYRWLVGVDAVQYILSLNGDSPSLIPVDFVHDRVGRALNNPKRQPNDHRSLAGRIRAYKARLPHREEGQQRDDIAYVFAAWLVRDLHLPDDVALSWLHDWDAGNRPPKGDARLVEII